MTTPTQPKPWYSCCLSATVEPEPQPHKQEEAPQVHSPAQQYHYAGKFSPAHIQARINPLNQVNPKPPRDIDATDGKALPTSRRHRKLDSTEVVDLHGALQRASITHEVNPTDPK
jgi:hypothetical protein